MTTTTRRVARFSSLALSFTNAELYTRRSTTLQASAHSNHRLTSAALLNCQFVASLARICRSLSTDVTSTASQQQQELSASIHSTLLLFSASHSTLLISIHYSNNKPHAPTNNSHEFGVKLVSVMSLLNCLRGSCVVMLITVVDLSIFSLSRSRPFPSP